MSGRSTKEAPNSIGFDLHFQTLDDPELGKALAEAHLFCREMECGGEPRWLSLLGPSGVGKTHLALWITRFFVCRCARFMLQGKIGWIVNEHSGYFWDWRKAVKRVRAGEYWVVDEICDGWFAAVDDIGAEYESGLIQSKLDEVANSRVGKWTVFTSNLPLHKVASDLDQRVASRMMRGANRVVEIASSDFALRRV